MPYSIVVSTWDFESRSPSSILGGAMGYNVICLRVAYPGRISVTILRKIIAPLAQLVEHLLCKQKVLGSIPRGGRDTLLLPSRGVS